MFINDSYVTYSNIELDNVITDLRNEGYECIGYSRWYEHWKKGDHVVVVEHDF